MFMTSFHQFFPDLARTEMRSVHISGSANLPDGEYGFFESYCDDPTCDCRRVLLNVYRSDSQSKQWAVISYGWEPVGFYRRWVGNSALAQEAKGPTLEPFEPQTDYAPALLELFKTMIRDEAYVQRIKRHYALVKGRAKPSTSSALVRKVERGRRNRQS